VPTIVNVENQEVDLVTVEVPIPGQQGPRGPAGASSSSYTHTQVSALQVWAVTHMLGRFPGGVYVVDADGNENEGIITHISINAMTITFYEAVAGTAYVS
jgi:hypothetical protein